MLEIGSEDETASETSSSAREMSELIPSLVLFGVGNDGESVTSQVPFVPDRTGGTRTEAAVA